MELKSPNVLNRYQMCAKRTKWWLRATCIQQLRTCMLTNWGTNVEEAYTNTNQRNSYPPRICTPTNGWAESTAWYLRCAPVTMCRKTKTDTCISISSAYVQVGEASTNRNQREFSLWFEHSIDGSEFFRSVFFILRRTTTCWAIPSWTPSFSFMPLNSLCAPFGCDTANDCVKTVQKCLEIVKRCTDRCCSVNNRKPFHFYPNETLWTAQFLTINRRAIRFPLNKQNATFVVRIVHTHCVRHN